ncbi:MAG: enoyl-CoA hydratase/isomerase family protein [Polyangia bacterium]
MNWKVESLGDVVIVTMRSNPVNKMNPQFFDDLHAAFDAVERDHPRLPIVLTAEEKVFSAGLDFEDVFPRFARADMAEIQPWFERFRDTLLRVLTMPTRTVAAIQGGAYAGGLILAVSCDVRIAAAGGARFSLNEVPIGIPMPGVYTEIVRYAAGSRSAAESILSGRFYDVEQALAAGFLHRVVPREQLLAEATAEARLMHSDSYDAYAASKRALLGPTMKVIGGDGVEFDQLALRVLSMPGSMRAQKAALERLKARGR